MKGRAIGTRVYDKKKYCKNCGEYVELDMIFLGKHDYQFHKYCGQRVRTKPRNPTSKQNYSNGKRIDAEEEI